MFVAFTTNAVFTLQYEPVEGERWYIRRLLLFYSVTLFPTVCNCLIGYGRPGPKGDKGDSGSFVPNSGLATAQKHGFKCCNNWIVIFVSLTVRQILPTQEHSLPDHLGHLVLQGLKEQQVKYNVFK